jgi:hypothetical protein
MMVKYMKENLDFTLKLDSILLIDLGPFQRKKYLFILLEVFYWLDSRF